MLEGSSGGRNSRSYVLGCWRGLLTRARWQWQVQELDWISCILWNLLGQVHVYPPLLDNLQGSSEGSLVAHSMLVSVWLVGVRCSAQCLVLHSVFGNTRYELLFILSNSTC